jgi:ubiquitin C-terminal hydrolase
MKRSITEDNRNTKKRFQEVVPYMGLKNQGATCYMNTLLQLLFHLTVFRKVKATKEGLKNPKDCVSNTNAR